jgi:hypothetical protein
MLFLQFHPRSAISKFFMLLIGKAVLLPAAFSFCLHGVLRFRCPWCLAGCFVWSSLLFDRVQDGAICWRGCHLLLLVIIYFVLLQSLACVSLLQVPPSLFLGTSIFPCVHAALHSIDMEVQATHLVGVPLLSICLSTYFC